MERVLISSSQRLWTRLPRQTVRIATSNRPRPKRQVALSTARNFHTRQYLANSAVQTVTARAPDNQESIANALPDEESGVLYANISDTPPRIVGSRGAYLYTADGREILDATGGAAVVSIGHNHPRVKEAILRQLDQVAYSWAPLFTTEAGENLAKLLVDSTGGRMSKVFVVSSGECEC